MNIRPWILLALLCVPCLAGAARTEDAPPSGTTREALKVAFIGDTEAGEFFRRVLQLIKDEEADLVLHQGDLGYMGRNTGPFMAAINEILGTDFPYFASRGNHDVGWERSYQPVLAKRARDVGAVCTGDYGQNSACYYAGLFFILSAGGEKGSESANTKYIERELAADDSIWRICSWHKNQKTMQIEYKGDEVGWGPYEACRKGGAIIATGHGHSYARTRTLTNTKDLTVDPECDTEAGDLVCAKREAGTDDDGGRTFVFVSGLGGRDQRAQRRCFPSTFPYGQGRGCRGIWARIYSTKQKASHGALFITFYTDGDPYRARGEFINVHGEVIDSFAIFAKNKGSK